MANDRKPAVGFIFVTVLIDVMGFGLIIPVMPKLISQLNHIDVNLASPKGGLLTSVYAVMQFLFAPVMGNLSDRYGRRPVLLLSLLAFGLDYLILSWAPSYDWLFVGRVIAGITGATFTTASAYIADISTPETRAKNFGVVGAAFGLGFVIGPVLGGLIARFGLRAPFISAAILCFLNFLYGYFILPESLPLTRRRKFELMKANPFGSFKLLQRFPVVGRLAISYFLIYLAFQAVQGNWNFFTAYRFKWDESMIGISLGLVGVLVALVQTVVLKKAHATYGNEKSLYAGFTFYTLGLFLFAFAWQSWMMFAFLVPYCLGGLAGPSLQGVLAKHVPPNEQGALQGALTALMSLSTIIGPLLMTNAFKYFTTSKAPFQFPGVSFFIGGLMMLGAGINAYLLLTKEKKISVAA